MKRILIQLDTDPQPSLFDRVVAIDSGVDELFSYGGVTPGNVQSLVHGAMFTRGPQELNSTAIFIGGGDVVAGEKLLQSVRATFFGPVRVSVMMDSNGSNTTAVAAVLAAAKHLDLAGTNVLVLGGTGPVGQRVAQLLAMHGARVRVGSRSRQRAQMVCDSIVNSLDNTNLTACATASPDELSEATRGVQLIIASGAASVELMTADQRANIRTLEVAIDLNAVPPVGLTGIEATDKGAIREEIVCYGAIGVGRSKMKIHKAVLNQLFKRNDQVFDTHTIFEIGKSLGFAAAPE